MFRSYLKTSTINLKSFQLYGEIIDNDTLLSNLSAYKLYCKEDAKDEWTRDVETACKNGWMSLEIKIYEIVGIVLKNIEENKDFPITNIYLYLLMSGLVYESELYSIVQIVLEIIIKYSPKGYDYIKILLEDKRFDNKVIRNVYTEYNIINRLRSYAKYCIESKRNDWIQAIENLANKEIKQSEKIYFSQIKMYENAGYIMEELEKGTSYEEIKIIIKNWSSEDISILSYMLLDFYPFGIEFVQNSVNPEFITGALLNYYNNIQQINKQF